HPLLGQRASVLDGLLADLAEARIHRRVVHVRRLAIQHAARSVVREEVRKILGRRIVRQFWFLGSVQGGERTVTLVEAVNGRKMLIAVAQVVLAELRGGVALRLEQLGDRYVAVLQALRSAGHADLGVASAEAALAGDERRASGRTALLGIRVREPYA